MKTEQGFKYNFDKPNPSEWSEEIRKELAGRSGIMEEAKAKTTFKAVKSHYFSIESDNSIPNEPVKYDQNSWLYNIHTEDLETLSEGSQSEINSITLGTDFSLDQSKLPVLGLIRVQGQINNSFQNLDGLKIPRCHVISDVRLGEIFDFFDQTIEYQNRYDPTSKLGFEITSNFREKNLKSIPNTVLPIAVVVDLIARNNLMNNDSVFYVISCKVDDDFFESISKLRAIRKLWNLVSSCYPVSNIPKLMIHAEVEHPENEVDEDNALLCQVTRTVAAVCGGCDILTNNSKTLKPKFKVALSSILKHEGFLTKVADPYAGAYAIESYTNQLVMEGINSLKEIESAGGIAKYSGL